MSVSHSHRGPLVNVYFVLFIVRLISVIHLGVRITLCMCYKSFGLHQSISISFTSIGA